MHLCSVEFGQTREVWALASMWGTRYNLCGPWRDCRRIGAIAILQPLAEELIAYEFLKLINAFYKEKEREREGG